MRLLEKRSAKFETISVRSKGLKTVFPFGQAVFLSSLRPIRAKVKSMVFEGPLAERLATG